MSVKRAYSCDLCGDPFKNPDDLIGWEWGAYHDGDHQLRRMGARSVEHHFCAPCLVGVRRFHDEVEASDNWPEVTH